MARDPYGFQAPEPAPPPSGGMAAPLLATVTLVLSSIVCLGCTGLAGLIAADSHEDRFVDQLGVGIVASSCAWPAAATAFWTLLLLLGFRRPWLQAGPNLVLGITTGLLLWGFVCMGVAAYAGITEPGPGP